ncbi:uncharacterized protein LOC125831096 [Solanum verrucosum]|uniref:uncharacterized protein LOC125807384 n=1 Tax=Solanum verrucosum TaxID=315347 RepID=UPI0020D0D7B1|nr:uncharacterized protein LOC125807384 [Solanum verrucosum]XP_049353507.1 uncharacterized protein LOC125818040 [Solanum verrucosum]XP_049366241.1 uncharacterized protein LOC125831096 [Solanum verrucosum]
MEVDPLEIDVEEQVEYQQDNIDVVESSQEWTTWRDELAQSIADNGTFRPGYLMELEHYLREHHPESGLKGEPHVNSKLKFWKRSYASLSLLKGRSGLGFQYSDGTIIIDDPKEWDKFLKDEPGASNMNSKKWPLFADWEEIFGKDRATGEHAEGPLDAVEDILKSRTSGLSTDMSLGFLINVDDDEYEDESSHGPNAPTEEAENTDTGHNFTQTTENEYAGGSPREHTGPSEKQGKYAKTSSSSVNEKEKGKKRKRVVEDVNETFLKSMTEVMKSFTESQDKRIGSLIDKIGNRDHSDMRGQIYSIIESPTFDLYTIEQRIKAKKVICEDVKNMEIFLRMGELERQTMMFMSFCFSFDRCFGEYLLKFYSCFSCCFSCSVEFDFQANSEHPIAKAVVDHAKKLRLKHGAENEFHSEIKNFEVHTGAGVSRKVGERKILVENRRLMHAFNVPVSSEVDNYISEHEHFSRTCVLVAVDEKIAGAFAVTDPVKPDAARVVSFLHSMDITSVMVTGDNWAAARAIASEVGIQTVFAETDPLGKADKIFYVGWIE